MKLACSPTSTRTSRRSRVPRRTRTRRGRRAVCVPRRPGRLRRRPAAGAGRRRGVRARGRGRRCAGTTTPRWSRRAPTTMHRAAEEANVWTRARLTRSAARVARGLPLVVRRGMLVFVHSSAERPSGLDYVTDPVRAAASAARGGAGALRLLRPRPRADALLHRRGAIGRCLPAGARRRDPASRPAASWLAIVGSAGQPRDGNTAACYAMLDLEAERADVPSRAVRLVRRRGEDPRRGAARSGSRAGSSGGSDLGALLDPGTVVDGFRVEERVHAGGMARALPRQPTPDAAFPLMMKVPRLGPGEPAGERHLLRDRADGARGAAGPARAALRGLARGRRAAAVHRHGVRRGPLARRSGWSARPSPRRRWRGSAPRSRRRCTRFTSRTRSTST